MKNKKIFSIIILLIAITVHFSCSKEDTPSPYAEMNGTYSGDMAITGDKTLSGPSAVTVIFDGNDVKVSFTYGDYPISFSVDVTEVQTDKDVIYRILQQDLMVNGNQVSIIGHLVSENYPSIHGTYSYTNKTLTFSFTYTSPTETLVFYFIGDKN